MLTMSTLASRRKPASGALIGRDADPFRFVDAKFIKAVSGETVTARARSSQKHHYGPEETGFQVCRRGEDYTGDLIAREVGYNLTD